MAIYECGGNLYAVGDDGIAHPVSLTAKDKKVVSRELESVSTEVSDQEVELPAGAHPVTMSEVIAKFNLTEDNPVTFDEKAHKASLKEDPSEASPKDAPADEEDPSEAKSSTKTASASKSSKQKG